MCSTEVIPRLFSDAKQDRSVDSYTFLNREADAKTSFPMPWHLIVIPILIEKIKTTSA